MTTEFNVEDFNPKKSPKYSPSLYKWMKCKEVQPLIVHGLKVYKDKESRLWIGNVHDEFLGSSLLGVLCNGAKEIIGWRYDLADQLTELPVFWEEYKQAGRCAIDPDHGEYFVGEESRWHQEGNVRHCLWCGKVTQQLHTWTETIQRQTWRNQA